MTTRLKELLNNLSNGQKTDEELERGVRNLIGFARCLYSMKQEILENESRNTNPSINQNAGRRLEFDSPK